MHIVFEGGDAVGKTTIVGRILKELEGLSPIHCIHPGSTVLGLYLRSLVKNPASIDKSIKMTPLARQTLYAADYINFIQTILVPATKNHQLVISDRSMVSMIAYGIADGICMEDMERLSKFCAITEFPKIDKMYVLHCPIEVSRERVAHRNDTKDHYDNETEKFFEKIHDIYTNKLIECPRLADMLRNLIYPENIVRVDTNRPVDDIVSEILSDIAATGKIDLGA